MSLAQSNYMAFLGTVQVTPSTTCAHGIHQGLLASLCPSSSNSSRASCLSVSRADTATPHSQNQRLFATFIFPSAMSKNVSVVPAPYKKAFYSLYFHLTLLINYFIYLIGYPKFSVFPCCRFSLSLHYLSFLELLPSTPTVLLLFL